MKINSLGKVVILIVRPLRADLNVEWPGSNGHVRCPPSAHCLRRVAAETLGMSSRSFHGCLRHLLFRVPSPACERCRAWHCTRVPCSSVHRAAAWETRLWLHMPQRWTKGLPATQKLVANITWRPLTLLVNAKHIESCHGTPPAAKNRQQRNKAHICL